uniref:oligosaccharide flippase family protein n=1 Tax=Flavobacterium sp. TaxID=239 RepID=UPI004048759A
MQKIYLALHQRLDNLLFSKLARASTWLFIGGIAGGILSYVFQLMMGRMLSTQEYGLFSAIMALFAVLASPLSTLVMVVSRKVSEYRAKQDTGSIFHFYYSINLKSAIAGMILAGVCYFLATDVQLYLKAPTLIPVYLLGALMILSFLPVINNAFLQGLQSFNWLSASSFLVFLFKIVFSGFLVWFGYGVVGAIGGTLLAMLLVWLITYRALLAPLAAGRGQPFQTAHLSFKSTLPVFFANTAFAAMTQLDMVLVNYYFSAHEAGLYAAASTLGKAIMYLPAGIAIALFPMVAENHARDEGSSHLLLQALRLVFIFCGAGSVFYLFYGEWFVQLLYGERYQGAGELLQYYGFAIMPLALVSVAEYFMIAKGRVMFAYIFMIAAPLQILAVYLYHESLLIVIGIIATSGLLVACVGFGLLWREFKAGGK